MIQFVSSQPHYASHLLPIMDELVRRGIEVESFDGQSHLADDGTPTVIAGMGDQSVIPHSRPLALLSHGIDQQYFGVDHASYAGGRNRERVSLFLCSTPQGMAANQAVYPAAAHVLVGPTVLDQFIEFEGWLDGGLDRPIGAPVTVGFAWHWNCTMSQEMMSALPYYLPALGRFVASTEHRVIGTAHPKGWDSTIGHYERLGIEAIPDAYEFLAQCDLVCADNTSLLYEAAAFQRPVLALDAPFYRDQPRQPPRFYADVPGLRLRAYRDQAPSEGIVHPEWGRDHLAAAIGEALDDRAGLRALRADVVGRVYGRLDGKAAARAADAVMDWAHL